ncbi:IS3 family transposase [Actinomadura xylanilytica]|uniref:IS3 family transposase n=1 Tax=Actinomadura xylanilytica TaxID=887459 RepID=UPI00255A8DC3|nr:IS3 family transposase [Actinomadura xylanilytica]MDL4774265.1 IS3 family transposase [Actinomadura xylanilytica]
MENEVKILRKAAAAVEQVVPPKARFALVAELAVEGVPVKQACLALGVSRSGFYDARTRPPSARVIRQAWLTDQITAIHQASRQTCGSPRVRAELVQGQGQGVVVSRKTVAILMQRAGLAGCPCAATRRTIHLSPVRTYLLASTGLAVFHLWGARPRTRTPCGVVRRSCSLVVLSAGPIRAGIDRHGPARKSASTWTERHSLPPNSTT